MHKYLCPPRIHLFFKDSTCFLCVCEFFIIKRLKLCNVLLDTH